jgi:hypothetical protein
VSEGSGMSVVDIIWNEDVMGGGGGRVWE